MNNPSRKLLESGAPLEIWNEAIKQAKRSTLHTFKTGTVIFRKKADIVGVGTSHHNMHKNGTVHAEEHAVDVPYVIHGGNNIVIVTLGKAGNFAFSSRPCYACAKKLYTKKINTVIYAERLSGGKWILNIETPKELIQRAETSGRRIKLNAYARDMRIS